MLTVSEGTIASGGHLSPDSAECESELVHFAFSCFDLDSLYLSSSTYLLFCFCCQKGSAGLSKQHFIPPCWAFSLSELFTLKGKKALLGSSGSCLIPASSLTSPSKTSAPTPADHKGLLDPEPFTQSLSQLPGLRLTAAAPTAKSTPKRDLPTPSPLVPPTPAKTEVSYLLLLVY